MKKCVTRKPGFWNLYPRFPCHAFSLSLRLPEFCPIKFSQPLQVQSAPSSISLKPKKKLLAEGQCVKNREELAP